MASIVTSLNPASTSNNLGWSIGRPIMAAGLLTIFVPLLHKFAICPLYIRFLAPRIISRSSPLPMAILVLTLAALCTGAAYAGTSILYGAYLAGVVLTYLDAHTGRTTDPGVAPAPNQGHTTNGDITTYVSIFHTTIGPLQSGFLEPLFFASIGFAIPFRSAWQGTVIWRGVVYTLLMLIGKAVVGGWLPIWTHGPRIYRSAVQRIHQVLRSSPSSSEMSTASESPSKSPQHPERRSCTSTAPALLLGCMMVARGEIGLLILQLGYIQSGHVSDQGFLVGTWAVVLNTLIGPIAVGMITRRYGEAIIQGEWGDVDPQPETGARRIA
jgi:Kef-type K+ transport system membrane component KefB